MAIRTLRVVLEHVQVAGRVRGQDVQLPVVRQELGRGELHARAAFSQQRQAEGVVLYVNTPGEAHSKSARRGNGSTDTRRRERTR